MRETKNVLNVPNYAPLWYVIYVLHRKDKIGNATYGKNSIEDSQQNFIFSYLITLKHTGCSICSEATL